MTSIYYILVTLMAVLAMEFVAWFAHKYIMHGLLWNWHEDHHQPAHQKDGFFEKNDRFFIVFAIPSMLSFIMGASWEVPTLLFVGLGILIYGMIYFLIHDVYIHKRFSWFRHLDNKYSRAILRAHGAHHAKQTRENCESFGLLIVNGKYLKKGKQKVN